MQVCPPPPKENQKKNVTIHSITRGKLASRKTRTSRMRKRGKRMRKMLEKDRIRRKRDKIGWKKREEDKTKEWMEQKE